MTQLEFYKSFQFVFELIIAELLYVYKLPRKPHFAGTLHMQGGVLQLSLQESGQPAEELLLILQALREGSGREAGA